MKNQLAHRFKVFSSQNINLGNYIVLSKAVRAMKYPRHKIYAAFNKYVPHNDYCKKDRDSLMMNLEAVTNDISVQPYGLTEPNEN